MAHSRHRCENEDGRGLPCFTVVAEIRSRVRQAFPCFSMHIHTFTTQSLIGYFAAGNISVGCGPTNSNGSGPAVKAETELSFSLNGFGDSSVERVANAVIVLQACSEDIVREAWPGGDVCPEV
jgi:hypothetical protein